ncbi:MAG: DNA repair protein RadA [Candidatus Stahlbacteria bacterium]|nr:DNA repair protein RadA [Candidatus Stahlbacteria bacterium]
MPKQSKRYVCQSCGYSSPQWLGKCPTCGEWSTLIEEIDVKLVQKGRQPISTRVPSQSLSEIEISPAIRTQTKLSEFDRVLGGGIVEGSLVLVGGEPGIGKSTLLLQAIDRISGMGKKVLYVSGEESPTQIKLRASRLGIENKNINILMQTDILEIENEISLLAPDIIIIDSIQTCFHSEISAIPGSVSQVKECTLRLMQIAKTQHISVFIVGHVTKEGAIAGPKTLEHIVDTVLYLEGDKNHFYRILRAAKNRFGSTHEIGVFEMKEEGMTEVIDPSMMFLGERKTETPGNVVTCAMEGSRPFLVEIQALMASCVYRMPQRIVSGIEYNRLAMLLAIIERRLGIKVYNYDVFINVVGGLHIEETASDLAIILAIVSGIKNSPIPQTTAIVGEVGLGGEVRPIGLLDKRVKEIERLGFSKCIAPAKCKANIKIIPIHNIKDAINEALNK